MSVPLPYRIRLPLLYPLIVILLLRELKNRGGGKRFLQQRLGFGYPANTAGPFWLHAASVGELNTALPLVRALQTAYPKTPFVISTNTPTAAARFERLNLTNCMHCYLPLDLPGSVRRFIHALRPRLGLIMETELWPNLFSACASNRIPLLLLNGRLSPISINAATWIRQAQQYCVQKLDYILARSNEDERQFLELGAATDRIQSPGNLKYASSADDKKIPAQTHTDRPYILAVSTHQNEEKQFSELLPVLKIHQQLLVIAPRHPERRRSILRQLAGLPWNIALRSRNDIITGETDIYLLDTMGELQGWFADATLVLIGGSWVPHGGQNLLEPARAGRPIIAGPHMHNFAKETADLTAHKAMIQLQSKNELASTVEMLLRQPQIAVELGRNAREFMQQKIDIVDAYLEALRKLPVFEDANKP